MKQATNITLTSIGDVQRSFSLSMKQHTRTRLNQRWKLDFNFNALTELEYREISAFIAFNRQGYDSFTVQIPALKDGFGSWGTVTVHLDGILNQTSLKVEGTPSTTIIKAGDFFTVQNDTKVYQATTDCTTDSFGVATLKHYPALVSAPGTGYTLTGQNVEFTVKLVDSDISVPIANAGFYSLKYSVLEDA